MTKANLVARISEIYPYMSLRNVNKIISIVIGCIVKALKEERRVELRGFGSFWVKNRPAARRRNPRTGETVEVSDRKVPFFKAGKQLKEEINGITVRKHEYISDGM
ncbi:MAG: integration host factor subunit beta [Alphaproteobacteria bacterium]|nr:integration host factor subunit beta [Alphaproteobacteria bacterium]